MARIWLHVYTLTQGVLERDIFCFLGAWLQLKSLTLEEANEYWETDNRFQYSTLWHFWGIALPATGCHECSGLYQSIFISASLPFTYMISDIPIWITEVGNRTLNHNQSFPLELIVQKYEMESNLIITRHSQIKATPLLAVCTGSGTGFCSCFYTMGVFPSPSLCFGTWRLTHNEWLRSLAFNYFRDLSVHT